MAAKGVDAVSDRTSILLGALAGAVVGGCMGYLFLTDEGRRLREDLEPRLADLATEVERARSLVKNARANVRPFER
ncbi:MAG: YtxH domain-containing protein [Acidobacteria bacterium]|jgi:gas vesicle protein|nr:YtxH domain-containing protein [Acidobacteriota bacterium]